MLSRLTALVLILPALVLVGCGGSNDSGNAGEPAEANPLSQAELVKRADAVCRKMQDQLRKIPPPQSLAELEKAVDKQVEASDAALGELKTLTPPNDLEQSFNSWTAKLATINEKIAKVRDAAASGSETKVNEVTASMGDINTEAGVLAKKLGLTVCS